MNLKTIEWVTASADRLVPGRVRMIDQTRLPTELVYLDVDDVKEIWDAIKQLKVRGAPAIGVAAAMGVVCAIQGQEVSSARQLIDYVDEAADYLSTSRPTAVNLFWALDRMKAVAHSLESEDTSVIRHRLAEEAVAICTEDAAMCRAIGEHGSALLKKKACILTHCNAGSLATAQFGTALAPVYVAREQGKDISVVVDETRPLLQGSRLTAWELMQEGIDVTLICDSMAAQVMREGRIDAVMVGADRIAANGDAANKIGTYGIALLAKAHDIPFYVLAPTSTIDFETSSGEKIPIENRDPAEVTEGFGRQTAPQGVSVYSPAFDVTPAELIHAIVCEHGIAEPPYEQSLRDLVDRGTASTATA